MYEQGIKSMSIEQGFKGMSVRFFSYEFKDDEGWDLTECFEEDFLQLVNQGYAIDYQRHTVRENGVSQICLTVKNI
jgi:hypothetical protein